MSDYWLYFTLGLQHVLDWQAYDHMLFLVLLIVSCTFADWKRMVLYISLFTLGHTASMVLAMYKVVEINTSIVEFFIPITIAITGAYNIIIVNNRESRSQIQYVLVVVFGLIHGMGFSTYFDLITDGVSSKAVPLLFFAMGIEVSQLFIVFVAVLLSSLLQTLFKITRRDWGISCFRYWDWSCYTNDRFECFLVIAWYYY